MRQSFAGDKTFEDDLDLGGAATGACTDDSTTTGTGAQLPAPPTMFVSVTNGSLVSIEGIINPLKATFFALTNNKGSSLFLLNETGTLAEQIFTGTGSDLEIEDGGTVWPVSGHA
ncbi:MAG: hypothetical protein HC888_13880 [Candidatus Competibacteraceae bacterium]|nr:hypothetical protein [Candidatus Competibacteraceae bacterium]